VRCSTVMLVKSVIGVLILLVVRGCRYSGRVGYAPPRVAGDT
jgi:hypothetical protein